MSNNGAHIPSNEELARLHAALQQAETQWRISFDQAAIGMVHMTVDRKWLRINQHFCAMLGYSADELYQHKPIQEVTHPADWAGNATGMQQLLAGEITSYVTNKRYIHRNGSLVWGRLTLRLARTDEGAPDYFVAIIEDITALKQAEAALRVSEERHRHIVEAQVDPICRFGPDYRLTFVNEPYAALYGKHSTALLGKCMLDIVPPEYHAQIMAKLGSLTKEHPVAVSENPAHLAGGLLHWFHWNNRLIELPDGTIEYQGVGRDITDRKLAEEAERQQRQLAEVMRDSLAALASSLDVEQVMTQILASAATVVPSDTGSVLLFEEGYWRVAYSRGFSPEVAAAIQQSHFALAPLQNFSDVFTHKAPYVVLDTQVDETWTTFPITNWIRSSIGVPIECNGQMIGLLTADSRTPYFFQPQAVETLQAFAHYAGLALQNAYQATRLEQRVAERTAALEAAKEEVESILNHSSDAILLVQPDLQIIQRNAVFDRLFPTYVAGTLGPSLLAFVHPADQGTVQAGLALVLREGGSHSVEIRACDGNERCFDAELSISLLDGRGFVCTLRDIMERKAREQQLLYYASIQASVNEAVIAIDLEYRIQSWNKAAETIFGWRAAEVIGQTTLSILHTRYPDGESIETRRQTLFEQGYWQGEVIQHHKDGTPRTIAASITLLRDAQGVPFGMVAISRDITAQKQLASALQESRYFIQQIVDTAPSIIQLYDVRANRHTFINRNITNLLGYSVEEFSTGQRLLSEVMHPDDRLRYVAHRKQVLAGNDGQVFTNESRLRHKNGTWRWFLIQTTIFQRTADGVPSQILGVATEITAGKEAVESLRQHRDMLQQIIDLMPALILVQDRAGYFQLVNQRTAQVYGTTAAHMVGKTDGDLNPNPATVAFFHQKDQEIFTTGQPLFVPEQTILNTYYQLAKIPLKNEEGEIDRLLVVAVDISLHKQAATTLAQALQTEQELNQHKSAFITTTSHEFRTPLAAILSLTETLLAYRHRLPDEQITQRLEKIKGQVAHLKTLLTDVLELEQIRTKALSFTPVALDLNALCAELLTDFQQVFAVTQQLVYQTDRSLPLVTLDNRLLRHIVTNLLSNAVKYSPPASTITVSVQHTGAMLRLQVHDDGIGIPAADLKQLFQPFYRASNVSTIAGTGLGLTIVKEAVALHGGTITVESELGVGTTFTVQLPIV